MPTQFLSPLRYPGGKRKLAKFMATVFTLNELLDGEYAEPYAGGASIALALLYGEYVRNVHINDIDRSIFAFWYSVLHHTEALCRLVNDTPVTMKIWRRQKLIQRDPSADVAELGFSTFFLNRSNRSGIISGGVIGGKNQDGKWSLDARYNKKDLIARIQKVARYRSRIKLYCVDAAEFIQTVLPTVASRSLAFLDPPYFVKGSTLLYKNSYEPRDHNVVANNVAAIEQPWIVSYDDVPEVRSLYRRHRHLSYSLHYSAQARYRGNEIMFFSDHLRIPALPSLTRTNSIRFFT